MISSLCHTGPCRFLPSPQTSVFPYWTWSKNRQKHMSPPPLVSKLPLTSEWPSHFSSLPSIFQSTSWKTLRSSHWSLGASFCAPHDRSRQKKHKKRFCLWAYLGPLSWLRLVYNKQKHRHKQLQQTPNWVKLDVQNWINVYYFWSALTSSYT